MGMSGTKVLGNLNVLGKGTFIGKKRIGSGKFGKVYVADYLEEKGEKREVAVKICKKEAIEKLKRNYLDEINLMSGLDHPRIIKFLGWSEKDNKICHVLELVTGGDLYGLMRANKWMGIEETKTKEIMVQIAEGMEYLNSKSVMHLDIKAENILLEGVNVKICDFGFAKVFERGKLYTEFLGTIYYLSPEMIARCYNWRTDIWSLGVLYFEMITGKLPWPGDDDKFILRGIKYGEIPAFNASITSMHLINRMLCRFPEERPSFASIKEQLLENLAFIKESEGSSKL